MNEVAAGLLARLLRGVIPKMVSAFQGDIGWSGTFKPMVVSASTLEELRNLAGMPEYPGQKMVKIDLVTGTFSWIQRAKQRSYGRKSRRR